MRLSARKTTELFNAISNEIMDYRIAIQRERCETVTPDRVEKDLFYLTNRVWSNVQKTLGIGTAAKGTSHD